MSEIQDASGSTIKIPNLSRIPNIPNLKKQQQQQAPSPKKDNNNDYHALSPADKIIYLKTKIAHAEGNLNNLKRDADIKRVTDSIIDWKRQLNVLNKLHSEGILQDEEEDNIDVFELITLNTKQVSTRRSNALIVTGQAGVGKTMTVIQAVAYLNPHRITNTVLKVDEEDNTDEADDEIQEEEEYKDEIKVDIPEVKPTPNVPNVPKISNVPNVVNMKRVPPQKKSKEIKVLKPTVESKNNSESGYFIASGACTAAALYELLFIYRKLILILDDFDSVLKDPDCINLLKAALDTYPIREITRMTKGNTFNSFGMSDAEMQEKYELEGKLPNQFRFTGGIIFVSNVHEEKLDKAFISRALHVEVRLSRQQVIERMLKILPDIKPEVSMEHKIEALNYLDYLTFNYKCKFSLELRQLIHTIDNRSAYPPEDPDNVKVTKTGKKILVWQQMAKERLIERKFKYQ